MSELCTQAHAWLDVGGESDEHYVVTRERCVHCGEERTTETPRATGPRFQVTRDEFGEACGQGALSLLTPLNAVLAKRPAEPALLTALDRADIRRELAESAMRHHSSALLADRFAHQPGNEQAAASWRARALRIRQLIALLAVLLLSACAASHGRIDGPPLYVHLCNAMPAADAEAWGAAAGELNAELGAPALWVGHGPPRGCDSVDVCPSSEVLDGAETRVGECVITVRYAPGQADELAAQELESVLVRLP